MNKSEIINLFDALPEKMKKEYIAFILFLKDIEDSGEPRPASQEKGSP